MHYYLRRILEALPLLVLVSIAVFFLIQLVPGGPLADAERNPNITPQQLAILRARHGLDDPLPVQYVRWVLRVLQGDLGTSIRSHRPVSTLILERLPHTGLLVGVSLSLTLIFAIPLGMLSAIKQGSALDFAATTFTFLGQSIPPYWLGLILIAIFYIALKNPLTGDALFPSGGMYSIDKQHDLLDRIWHLVLPVTMLCLTWVAWYSRYARACFVDVLHQDFMRTAQAKGLSKWQAVWKHGLNNALIPLITIAALDVPALFSGILFVEIVFAWPGMGRLFWDSARARDYPVLLAIVLINSILIVLSNLIADYLYVLLDPRVRFDTR